MKTQQEHIHLAAEAAAAKIDWVVDEMSELGELRWFEGFLRFLLPPGLTGYFFFEYEIAYKIAELHGLDRNIARIVIERISPKGARIALDA